MNFRESISKIIFFNLLMSILGCASLPPAAFVHAKTIEVPFRYYHDTFMVVPVTINGGVPQDFIFDTGIGINLISKSICAQLACQQTGIFTGKRMSGQAVKIPMTSVSSLSFGDHEQGNVPVGIFDIESMISDRKIVGFLSLGFFKNIPYSVDYTRQVITFEDTQSLLKIRSEGTSVPIKLDVQGDSLDVFLQLSLPRNKTASVEVDTGSQELILDEHYMRLLGITKKRPGMRLKKGKDETGHSYLRYFTELNGSIGLSGSSQIEMKNPKVMFQKIIYDGLIAHYFLSRFRVTFNIPASEMIFRLPGK